MSIQVYSSSLHMNPSGQCDWRFRYVIWRCKDPFHCFTSQDLVFFNHQTPEQQRELQDALAVLGTAAGISTSSLHTRGGHWGSLDSPRGWERRCGTRSSAHCRLFNRPVQGNAGVSLFNKSHGSCKEKVFEGIKCLRYLLSHHLTGTLGTLPLNTSWAQIITSRFPLTGGPFEPNAKCVCAVQHRGRWHHVHPASHQFFSFYTRKK